MTPLTKVAALAASLIALVSVSACGSGSPGGSPSPGASDSAAPSASTGPSAGATTPAAPAPPTAISGTLFFLGIGAGGGVYYLHSGTLTLAISDASFGFYQSAIMSPNGQRLAWIPNDSAGGTAQLRVQTYGGGIVNIGPSTINNVYTPQWKADSSAVVVSYGTGQFGQLNVTTGTLTPIPLPAGTGFGVWAPDWNHAILGSGGTANVALPNGSSPVPVVAPAGQKLSRIQSLSNDAHHVIALVKPVGSPDGDAARTLAANSIVDTTTGAIVPLSDGATIKSGFYRADGTAVLRVTAGGVDQVRIVSAAGVILSTANVPAAAASLVLMGYAP